MSVENINLFHSVLDEALVRLGKKNLKLKECQYEAVKAVVVDRKDMICILPTGYGKSHIPASSLRLIEPFISNACAVRATYNFLYVDRGLSQSLRFLPKGSQARGTRLVMRRLLITNLSHMRRSDCNLPLIHFFPRKGFLHCIVLQVRVL